jgi:hypothetical protein
MRKISVKICEIAEQDHRKKMRWYSHTYCKPNTICVSSAFLNLPEAYQVGILVHEVGHLLTEPDATEKEADRAANKYFGVRIKHKNTPFGKNLQCLFPKEISKARPLLAKLIKR